MKLVRLQLHGFKSFAHSTELKFHDGITVIVGPNGCGKSNIADAIRWALGEQRASAIRSSRMDDAIFQGTAQRRGVNRAEVALVFSNHERRLALPQSEIEIKRVVFREGSSDYQLNRQSCRLRDIHDLCRDTGLGANAYAVIEQGMVDAILSDRAEERRHLFEEAAGIGRYKDRRKAAMRRLDAAEADLSRLQDLTLEVETKVRGLARQRKRAQRYEELRARRLVLELALAQAEMLASVSRLREARARLEALSQDEPSGRAELATAEAELERQRLESADASRSRSAVALKLEEVARAVAERERELAVADERRAHAKQRLLQIGVEREELGIRVAQLESELEQGNERREIEVERTASLAAEVSSAQAKQLALREELAAVRRADEETRRREHDLVRRLAQLEADAVGADARAAEATTRLGRLVAEHQELSTELQRLAEQGDLFAQQQRGLAAQRGTLEGERATLLERIEHLREEESEARSSLTEAEAFANQLAARVGALETLERDFHGFAPAVAAALAHREQLPGLQGPVAEFVRLDPQRAAAVEGTLGSLLQTLVVEDAGAADSVRQWLAAQVRVPDAGGRPPAKDRAGQSGDGARGMLALLPTEALPRLDSLLEALHFAGEPASEPVLIGRRARLAQLRSEAEKASRKRDAVGRRRALLAEQVAAAEAALREADARVHALELDLRRADADEAARTGQRSRAERLLEELARQREDLAATATRSAEEAEAARTERAAVSEQLEAQRLAANTASEMVASSEQAWEAAREREAEIKVAHARAEAALAEADRRIAAARAALAQAHERRTGLDREESGHTDAEQRLADSRAGGEQELQSLFATRDRWQAELRQLDERLGEFASAAMRIEERTRELRRHAGERNEERHRLELTEAEARATLRGIRERLEAEWRRPFQQLMQSAESVEGHPEGWRAELSAVGADIERLGPINMLAIEEHEEESRRLEFLQAQRQDLERACEDLRTAIRQINRTARQLFLETFESVRQNFTVTFRTLFEGGECDLWLVDPDDPLESDIEVSASPRGKRTQRIHLLSGGERALAALALLFAIYLVKPSPFCVLDEVDAPLDEANISRFLAMLQRFKGSTQFIVITHNPRTMEAADWIYGVTMEEPGISTIVGVQLNDAITQAAS
jgi:chromosome segregation protein